jgi:DNA processing protein
VRQALLTRRQDGDPFLAVEAFENEGLAIVTSLDEDYPPGLRSVADYPAVLYARGETRTLRRPAVAIVGTRRPTPYGRDVTAIIAEGLVARGIVVVSGLALGIDGAAHRAALEVGGRTVGVLGSGQRQFYPARHAELAAVMIRAQGAVISQFAPDTLPERGHFIARNRTVAAMARGVVVAEAPEGSGALSTAGWARRLGRVVMAVPGPVTSRTFDGCLGLLRTGAVAVAGADHVLEAVGLAGSMAEEPTPSLAEGSGRRVERGAATRPPGERSDRPGDETAGVLAALSPGEVVPFAMLLARTGLGAERLGALLGVLEVRGLVGRQPGHCYTRLESPRR